jgi:small-conductance mechanosensitive channel
MGALLAPEARAFEEWVVAIGVLVAAFLIAGAVKVFMLSRHKGKYGPLLVELGSTVSNFILVIGAGLFTELAPLKPKVALWISDAVYVVGVVIVMFLFRRAVMLSIDWGARRSPRGSTLEQGFVPLIKNVVTLFVFFTGAIFILKRFGQDVMSLLTALGVGSLAVGLAAKDTLANMIAGFTLVIDRNLKTGDRINMGGSIGNVEEIGLRSTRINTGDGNTLIVPNSELVNTKILNMSLPTNEGTTSGEIRVAYSVPFQDVRGHCLAAMGDHPKVVRERAPWVNLKSLSDGHQVIQFGFWVLDAAESGGVLSDIQVVLLERLKAARIQLEPPIQVPSGSTA